MYTLKAVEAREISKADITEGEKLGFEGNKGSKADGQSDDADGRVLPPPRLDHC